MSITTEAPIKTARKSTGPVAIVTGASSGIGAATARELARRGMRVVVAARRTAELEAMAVSIRDQGGDAIAIPVDISNAAQVQSLVERTHDVFGGVDVLVNNAGIGWTKLLVRSSYEEIINLININLTGAVLMTRAVLPGMLERDRGAIINVSSVCGRVAVEPLYSAAKYGIRGFSLSLRRQLAGTKVSVSLVSPGNIRTEMTKDIDEPMAEPEIVARAIGNVIERPRREVIVPIKHYATVLLEQELPGLADFAYRMRHRSGLRAK
jgi:short-subunit dehydrogenase